MNTISRPCLLAAVLCCTLFVLPSATARAQDAAAKTDKNAAQDNTLRERTIYIPYEKLRKVFEAEGRGVFLPYEEFQELWKAAREKRTPAAPDKAPVGALISEIENEGTVSGDVMQFKARLKIELLKNGWHKVPLRLANAAITRASIEGKPARLLSEPQQGYQLLIEKQEGDASPIELELEFAKAITRVPGRNQISLDVPQAPVSRWRITIPEPGVKVDIQPLLAASEVPDAKPKEGTDAEKKTDQTVVLAFVGAAPTVSIAWTPKTEGATGLTALATVKAEQRVRIAEGVTRTQCQLAYTISRAKLASLAVLVPADQKVVNVFDANVRNWSVAKVDDGQRIDVQLFEPAEGRQNLTIELEQFNDQNSGSPIVMPVVRATDVGRQQGIVVIQVTPGLRAEAVTRGGLLQVDAAELPATLKQEKWDFAYRYATVPFELKLAVEKVEPRVLIDSLTEIDLSPDRLLVSLSAVYTIERAGIFRLQWDLPEGYEVREVRGAKIAGAAPAVVDGHHLTGEKKTRLVVNLSKKALGRTGLLIRLEKKLSLPELLAPTGKAAQIPVVVPRVADGAVEDDRGRLLVRAPESLRVNPVDPKGLRAVSFAEALQGMTRAGTSQGTDLHDMLAFAFAKDPITLTLAAERRKPQVTIGQLLSMRIEDDTIKYEAVFHYDVLYSGIKSLRIDVPITLADKLRNQTKGIRDRVLDPAPADLPKGYQAWSFSGETELLGKGQLNLVWEEKLDKLGIGEEVVFDVPRLIPAKADSAPIDRTWGQLVLAKAETIDLRPAEGAKGLRPIDPQHDLMQGTKIAQAAQAFEFHGPWSLGVTATRYELQSVKHTSIEQALARMVVTRADAVAVQVLYRLRSAQQRLEVALPEGVVFDTEPLRINGRPVTLERGAQGRFFIPLTDASVDKPLLLDLRYTLRDNPGNSLDLPEFTENPAILKVYLSVYLPDEMALLGVSGPWTNEIRWVSDKTMNWWQPGGPWTDGQQIESLKEGIAMTGDPTSGFETDGRRYVFSTLRPTGPLELTKMNQTGLTAIVLALLVIGGLLLVATPLKIRVLAVGLLLTAMVLCGVFAPLFARQILDGYFLAAAAIVLLVWLVTFVYLHQPRPKPPASPPAVPTSSAPAPPQPATPVETEPAAPTAESDKAATDQDAADKNATDTDATDEEATDEGGKTNA